jgi:hypothetical protein
MTLVVCVTLVVCPTLIEKHDSDHTSRLWSLITAPVDERAACLTTSGVKDFTWSG